MNNDLMFSSNKDDWETPQAFFDDLNKEFDFNLDVCATKENAKHPCYIHPDVDALTQNWIGRSFCNPPYSESKKFIEHAYNQNMTLSEVIVMLLPARTDTIAFHKYIYHKAEIRFIKGRLTFGSDEYWAWLWEQEFIVDGKGNKKLNYLYKQYGKKAPAPFPSMLVIYR